MALVYLFLSFVEILALFYLLVYGVVVISRLSGNLQLSLWIVTGIVLIYGLIGITVFHSLYKISLLWVGAAILLPYTYGVLSKKTHN